MQSSEHMERCDNCSQLFPESKIHSHFSYCRRNIKKCPQCLMMVDINYKEEHDQEFHTVKSCQFCKKEFKGEELSRHEGVCKSKPKHCQYCQLNIAVSQFDKHIISCGSRTNTCPKCEKHIMLKDFAVHQVQCRGRVVEPPPQPPSIDAFRKKETRQEPRFDDYRFNEPQVTDPRSNNPRLKPAVQPPTNPTSSYMLPSSWVREEPKKVQPLPSTNTRVNPALTNQRSTNERNQRNIGTIQSRNNPPVNVQPPKNAYKKQQLPLNYYAPQEVPKRRQQPKTNPARRQQSNEERLIREQEQYLRHNKQQQRQKRAQQHKPKPNYNPINEADYINFDIGNEDVEMQKILMESMESMQGKKAKHKAPSGFEDLGIDHMTQSFYRDIQQQQQIEANLRRAVPKRR